VGLTGCDGTGFERSSIGNDRVAVHKLAKPLPKALVRSAKDNFPPRPPYVADTKASHKVTIKLKPFKQAKAAKISQKRIIFFL